MVKFLSRSLLLLHHFVSYVKVCGITEFLIPSKQYRNCSFSLTLDNGMEHTFSAEVNGQCMSDS